jgi:UDP:flavonoid glycosyltransferase YjiC (YdhE family)
MKVLIATMPFTGHINPFQRVAAELVRRSHEVLWLTGEDFREKVEITGATFVSPKFRSQVTAFDRKVGLGKGGLVIFRLNAHGLLVSND